MNQTTPKLDPMVLDSTQPTDAQPSILMYTTPWCGDCRRAKHVMASLQIPFTEVDITHDEEAVETVIRLNRGHRSVPTLLFPDGSILTEPANHVLVAKLQEYRRES